ncbi:MAG TPA: alkylphosphonate utilization protein [Saprospiraceae bacterium]|nr:alkylphosphonate utilization protein [Saprospiraceae bacterium]
MDEKIPTKDSNGNILAEGDSVLLTKDLKVKGFNKDLKRGTLIKNIRLSSDIGEIEGKVEGSVLVIKTMYLKKK